jgi:hypothetical protein
MYKLPIKDIVPCDDGGHGGSGVGKVAAGIDSNANCVREEDGTKDARRATACDDDDSDDKSMCVSADLGVLRSNRGVEGNIIAVDLKFLQGTDMEGVHNMHILYGPAI